MQLTIDQATTIADTRIFAFQSPVISAESASELYYHLIFRSDKGLDLISESERRKFYGFIFGCAVNLQGTIESIGGTGDSVQLLVSLEPAQTLADFVRKMKLFTAVWAKRKLKLPEFVWTDEEVLTVSRSQCRRVISDIRNRSFLF